MIGIKFNPFYRFKRKNHIITTADLYKNIIYNYSSKFIPKKKKRVYNSDFSATYIKTKSLTSLRFKSDKKENLHNQIISYAYEELLLNPSKEYKINYFINKDGSYTIYVIDMQIALDGLRATQKTLQNIDIVIPSALLMSGFYSSGLMDKNGVDCYIFFDENESYMSFYKAGEYIFHHNIIYDTIWSISKANGIECNGEIIDKNIDKFSDLIKATIETMQSIANIDKIIANRIFLSSFIGDLKGFNIALSDHLMKSVNGFDFLSKFNSKSVINLMIAIYAKELISNKIKLEFNIFDRVEPLYKRADGRLFIAIILGAILGMTYPIYMLVLALNLDIKSKEIKYNLSIESSSVDSLKGILLSINQNLDNISKEEQNIKNNINLNLNKIDNIAAKINNPNLAITLSKIVKSMDNELLRARSIRLNNGVITIAVVAQNTQNINNFINKFSIARVGQIINNKNYFESNITIGLDNGI